jgi:hypothetical protein
MDDVLASRFRKTRARRWFQNRKMKTQREHGHEVVGPGYSRLSGDATRVADRRGESGNPNRVDQVHQNTTQISEQIRLLRTAMVTATDTRIGG